MLDKDSTSIQQSPRKDEPCLGETRTQSDLRSEQEPRLKNGNPDIRIASGITPVTIRIIDDNDPTIFKTTDPKSYDPQISSKIGTHIRNDDTLTIYESISLHIAGCYDQGETSGGTSFFKREPGHSVEAELPRGNQRFHSDNLEGNIVTPVLAFLRSPQSGSNGLSDIELSKIQRLIDDFKLHYYTHSLFIINLSRPFTKKNPTSDKWIMGLLTKDLIETRKIGGRGVVVHVRKHCDRNKFFI